MTKYSALGLSLEGRYKMQEPGGTDTPDGDEGLIPIL